jgi:hypothetical protein
MNDHRPGGGGVQAGPRYQQRSGEHLRHHLSVIPRGNRDMTEFGVIARPITSTQTDASLTRDNRDKDEMLAYLEARVDALKAEVR